MNIIIHLSYWFSGALIFVISVMEIWNFQLARQISFTFLYCYKATLIIMEFREFWRSRFDLGVLIVVLVWSVVSIPGAWIALADQLDWSHRFDCTVRLKSYCHTGRLEWSEVDKFMFSLIMRSYLCAYFNSIF